MDIYCPTCNEPWDMDTIHEEIAERITSGDLAPLPDRGDKFSGPQYEAYRKIYEGYYDTVRGEFYRKGCKAMYAFIGGEPSWCIKPERLAVRLSRGEAMSALANIMGDDLDGIASTLEDAIMFGMVE
jgi:hypothetical protein